MYNTLSSIQADLKKGLVSCSQLVERYLKTIKEKERLNAFVEVFEEQARNQAVEVDKKIQSHSAGTLAGMVIGVKDVLCIKGEHVTASSRILQEFRSPYDATVIARLKNEDCIIIGRLNCDEFAMGSSNENSCYGPVLHPQDSSRVPGGSSGGSVVAVKEDMCLAALGTDTGGSIRQPASLTGVIGLKPTYGRVSRHGSIAYASSFDQIGPVSRSVEDCASILQVIAGKDEYDSTLSSIPKGKYSSSQQTGKVRVAYIHEYLNNQGLDPEIKERTQKILGALEKDGHTVQGVNFDYLDYLVPAYYVLTTAEASSNLARYDGVHYGYRDRNAKTIEDVYSKSRSAGFGEEVKRRIMTGTFVLSAGHYNAYYGKAQKIRRIIQDETNRILDNFDFIVTPTTPTTAFKLNENKKDPIAMYLQDIFTVQAPLAGIPAISLPLGTHSNGLPFGIQVMSSSFNEVGLFKFSSYLMNRFEND